MAVVLPFPPPEAAGDLPRACYGLGGSDAQGEYGPIAALRLSARYFLHVRPAVSRALRPIEERAQGIADARCRALALDAIRRKRFHCEGGAVLASGDPHLTRITVLYQTLCDYLDTLTDRGPRLGPQTIGRLHLSLVDALSPQTPLRAHWTGYPLDDGGYLRWLTEECRLEVSVLPGLPVVQPRLLWLARRYCELQSLKHMPDLRARAPALRLWHALRGTRWDVSWWEFAAACGSTLATFALLAEAAHDGVNPAQAAQLFDCYFPWIGGLHILLDYLVDQAEDIAGDDFNFVTCYEDRASAVAGIGRLRELGANHARGLEAGLVHLFIVDGLPAFYLADPKAALLPRHEVQDLLRLGGSSSRMTFWLAHVGRSP